MPFEESDSGSDDGESSVIKKPPVIRYSNLTEPLSLSKLKGTNTKSLVNKLNRKDAYNHMNKLTSKDVFGTNEGPCYLRVYIAIIETRFGVYMTARQFSDFIRDMQGVGYVYKKTDPDKENFGVNSDIMVMKKVLAILGIKATVSRATLGKAEATVLIGNGIPGFSDDHAVEGDKHGNFLWDPSGYSYWRGTNKLNFYKGFKFRLED